MKRRTKVDPTAKSPAIRRHTGSSKVHRETTGPYEENSSEQDAADAELRVYFFAKAGTDFMFTPVFVAALNRVQAPKDLAAYIQCLTELLRLATTMDGWHALRRLEPVLRNHAAQLDKRNAMPRKARTKPLRERLNADSLTPEQVTELGHLEGLVVTATGDKNLARRFTKALRRFEFRKNVQEIALEAMERLRRKRQAHGQARHTTSTTAEAAPPRRSHRSRKPK